MHPYTGLPDDRFWQRSISDLPLFQIDPMAGRPGLKEPITKESRIATAGSCFAQNIAQYLQRSGYHYFVTEEAPAELDDASAKARNFRTFSARYGNIYTPRQLVQLLKRAYKDFVPAETYWLRKDGRLVDPFRPRVEPDGFADIDTLLASREEHFAAVRSMFEHLDYFVFTLGLTEGWRSKLDGSVFPIAPGVTGGNFDPERHEFINFSVDEVTQDLNEFMDILNRLNPRCKVILTISPVPLVATFENQHVLQSTVLSKAILRVAASNIETLHANVLYFPSFEIINIGGGSSRYFEDDLRSVSDIGVDHVMRVFFRHLTDRDDASDLHQTETLRFRAEQKQQSKVVCDEEVLNPSQAG